VRHDVIVAGIGGRGALILGQVLAHAAADRYKYVTWCPNMTTARRGAPADCTVVLSDEEIASPLVQQAQTLILVDPSQTKSFEHRVQPGGEVFLEISGMNDKMERRDVHVLEVPGLNIAAKLGDTQVGNFVLFGAYVGRTKVISADSVEKELHKRFAGRNRILSLNIDAFREGMALTTSCEEC